MTHKPSGGNGGGHSGRHGFGSTRVHAAKTRIRNNTRATTEGMVRFAVPYEHRVRSLRRSHIFMGQTAKVRRAIGFIVDGKSLDAAKEAAGLHATRENLSRIVSLITGLRWPRGGALGHDELFRGERKGRSRLSKVQRQMIATEADEFWRRWKGGDDGADGSRQPKTTPKEAN